MNVERLRGVIHASDYDALLERIGDAGDLPQRPLTSPLSPRVSRGGRRGEGE